MFLSRLIYYSTPVGLCDADVDNILAISKAKNELDRVTGCLVYQYGTFLQVLEGQRTKITNLYNKISKDPRHKDVTLIDFRIVSERMFASWSMQYIGGSSLDELSITKYFPNGFDPKTVVDPEGLIQFLIRVGS